MKTITKGVLFLISVTAFGVERVIPNYDLNQGLHFGPPPLKKLFETHLSMYPKSLPHQYINFMTNLDRMVDLQGHLRNQISRMPGFQKDISERGPMIDLTIAVTESFEMQVGRFDPFFLNLFSSDMTQIIKGRVESAAKGLLASIRKRFPDLEYRMDGSLADFETNRKFEKILISYVMGYGLTNGWKSLDALKGDIHLGEGHIDYLAEKEMWGKALDGLLEEEKDQEKLIKLATDIFRRWEVRLKGSQDERLRTITVPKGETFHVYEVHPDLAILRGFVGNDCATDVSFGFPYSPFERNYYVANKKHDFLGYIALSIAEIAGERVIFFHTIAGPGVDYLASDLIVRAFVSKAKLIGGERMVMPEPNRIGENINYRAIEQTMLRYTQNSPYERMTWLDRDYRKVIISHGSSPHYDDPDRNQVGRPVKAEAGGIEVVHSFRPYVSPIFEPQPTVFEEGCGALLQHVSAASL